VDVTLPFSYSLVSSPRYQTLPALSWAYQSKVSSMTPLPASETVSRTTRAVTPLAILLVLLVTVTTTRPFVPSGAVSR